MAYYNRSGDDPKHKGTFDKDAFKRGIAYTESRNFENPYEAIPVNSKGELLSSASGKYQFLYNEIKDLPQMRGISKEEFLKNPELQEMIMDLAIEGKLPNRPGYYKNANDLTNSYAPLYGENWRYRPDEVAALTHYLGRKGARDYMRAQLEGRDYTVSGKTNMDVEDYLRTYNEGIGMGYIPETSDQSQDPYEERVSFTSGASYQQDPRVMRDMQSIDRMNPNNYRQGTQLPNNMGRGEFPTYIPPSGGMASIGEPIGNYSNDPRPQSQLTMPESQTTKPQEQLTGTEFIQQYIQTNQDKFANGGPILPKRRNGVRVNPDGTVSTHLMAYGSTNNGYVAHPTLFQNPDNSWVQFDDDKAFAEAKRRGEVYNFETEKEAINFSQGNWKKLYDIRNNPTDERVYSQVVRDVTNIGNRFEDGGEINHGGCGGPGQPPCPPVTVKDKNDPRYRAYRDSLDLYNQNIGDRLININREYKVQSKNRPYKVIKNPTGKDKDYPLKATIDLTNRNTKYNSDIKPIKTDIYDNYHKSDYVHGTNIVFTSPWKNDIVYRGKIDRYKKPNQPIIIDDKKHKVEPEKSYTKVSKPLRINPKVQSVNDLTIQNPNSLQLSSSEKLQEIKPKYWNIVKRTRGAMGGDNIERYRSYDPKHIEYLENKGKRDKLSPTRGIHNRTIIRPQFAYGGPIQNFYQDGGGINHGGCGGPGQPPCPDPINELYKSDLNNPTAFMEQKRWLKNWMEHPEYEKRLTNNLKDIDNKKSWIRQKIPFSIFPFKYGDDYWTEKSKEEIEKATNRLNRTKTFYSPENSDELARKLARAKYGNNETHRKISAYNTLNSAGSYGMNTVFLNAARNNGNLKNTAIHEYTHATGMDYKMIPLIGHPKEVIEKLTRLGDVRRNFYGEYYVVDPNNKYRSIMGEDELFKKAGLNKEDIKYMSGTSEVYPRIMGIRYDNDIKPGEIITKERLKEIKKKSTEPLFDLYSEDEILNLLNTLADNKKVDNINVAAYGGPIQNFYQDGGKIDPVIQAKKRKLRDERGQAVVQQDNTAVRPLGIRNFEVAKPYTVEEGERLNREALEQSTKQAKTELAKEQVFSDMQKAYRHPLGQPGMFSPFGVEDLILSGAARGLSKIATSRPSSIYHNVIRGDKLKGDISSSSLFRNLYSGFDLPEAQITKNINRDVDNIIKSIPPGGRFTEESLSADSFKLLAHKASANKNDFKIIPTGDYQPLNGMSNLRSSLDKKYSLANDNIIDEISHLDIDEFESIMRDMGALNKQKNEIINKKIVENLTRYTERLSRQTGKKIPPPKIIQGQIHIPQIVMERKGGKFTDEIKRYNTFAKKLGVLTGTSTIRGLAIDASLGETFDEYPSLIKKIDGTLTKEQKREDFKKALGEK